jgi:hypothetical protein
VSLEIVRAVWYRFRATFAQRRGSYLALIVLIGLVGGLSLAATAGARRTQSSYSTYLASTNPSDLEVFTGFDNPSLGTSLGFNPTIPPKLARLPYVKSVETVAGFDGTLAGNIAGARLRIGAGEKPPVLVGALGGEYLTQDRVHLVAGRLANPANPHEAVMNVQAAQELDVHLGSVLKFGLNSNAQENLINTPTGPSTLPPAKVASIKLVGLVVFSEDVVEDQYQALGSAQVLMTPALMREIAPCCSFYAFSDLQLAGGTSHAAKVTSEIVHSGLIPPAVVAAVGFMTNASAIASADRAIKPEAIALAVFGGLAGLATVIIASQIIGRQLRLRVDELEALRALGAGPSMVTADGTIGALASVIAGSLLAVIVAFGLSPLFPLGPVSSVTPVAVAFDWTVLGLGFVSMVAVLGGTSLFLARRQAPHRVSRSAGAPERPSGIAQVAAASGLPTPAVTGIRFALESGGRDAVPMRSAIFGAALAVLVVVATITFGSSLNTLLSRPQLYGWNWNYMLLSGFSGDEDLPAGQTTALLTHDHHVAAASGIYFGSVLIAGQHVSVLGTTPNTAVEPAILTGHGLEGADQIVLGAETMANLHARLGQTVVVSTGGKHPVRLVVVGTATMPALMGLDMGNGAVIDYRLIPAALRNDQGNDTPGPNAFLLDTRGGNSAPNLKSLQEVTQSINANPTNQGSAGGAISILRPTEIVNSRSIEVIPTILGAGLAAGAVAALSITLIASVRRRRRDLAVLRVLGLSGGQLATIVSWQSSVAVTIGTVVGVPFGIVVGRLLWDLFANAIHAVPAPSVPALLIIGIAVGGIVLANVVAALPGRIAARTPTALLLRAE